jgi:uncharacterized protein (TIGR04168 family)
MTLPPTDSSAPSPTLKIAVIGDVHHLWDGDKDGAALQALGVDLVLFVGDLGNEAVDLVRSIAALPLPKAVILGNHDAWYTMTDWGRKHRPYDPQREDWIQDQLDLLGEVHVGYGCLNLPELGLSVVGSRPFSWGGPKWRDKKFYRERLGVASFEESTQRIVAAAQTANHDRLIMIGHCGPQGLGDQPEDPCGRDWQPLGGDEGDPDFAAAIAHLQAQGKTIPLVAFGHMHHTLRHTSLHYRRSQLQDPQTGTFYLNAARTPRVQTHPEGDRRHFALVELTGSQVTAVTHLWVDEHLKIWVDPH